MKWAGSPRVHSSASFGAATNAGKQLYEGFVAITGGETQAQLKARYAEARQRSDDLHADVQRDLNP